MFKDDLVEGPVFYQPDGKRKQKHGGKNYI